jgi:hypothetical protein
VTGEQRISESPARVGGPARGYSWPPFEPGNAVSVRHGAYATLQLNPRAQEIAGWLGEQMGDAFDPKFSAAIETAALAFARVERAMGPLLELSEDEIEERHSRLDDRARGWLRLGLQTLEALGLARQTSSDVNVGPTTFVVVSAFAEPEGPHADVELEASEVAELKEAPVAGDRGEDSPYRSSTGTDERVHDEQEKP